MIAAPRTLRGKSLLRTDNDEIDQRIFVMKTPAEIRETVMPIGTSPGEVGFECEVISPASGVGRTVYIHVPPEQVLSLLKMCRRAAAAQREKAMSSSDESV